MKNVITMSSLIKTRLKAHARPMGTGEQLAKKLKNLHAMSLGHKLDLNSDENEDGKHLEKICAKSPRKNANSWCSTTRKNR
jgi:hypothetical protein